MLSRVSQLISENITFCMATIFTSENGEIPVGTKVLIFKEHHFECDIPLGSLQEPLLEAGIKFLKEKKKKRVEVLPGYKVFFDILQRKPRLIICGGGHVAVPLADFALKSGFNVTVIDDRPDFANAERFPGCRLLVEDFKTALEKVEYNDSAYFAIITRGHEHDADCLNTVLKNETAYIGLIGSKRRVKFVYQLLEENGHAPERVRDIFSPVGLPIGSDLPEEIALSIVSEVLCVFRKGAEAARSIKNLKIKKR